MESQDGNSIVSRAYLKVVTAADAGTSVKVVSSAFAKSDITVAAYRGTDTAVPLAVSASKVDNASGAAHVSPAVTAPYSASGWLVSYWADKSTDTTSWAAPTGQSVRSTDFGSSTGHISALLTDSGTRVLGPAGQVTATANSASSRGASFSVVLQSS